MSGYDNGALPSTPAGLEAMIQRRHQNLGDTIDELVYRTRPSTVIGNAIERTRLSLFAATHTDSGELRTEKVVAIGVAGVSVLTIMITARVRTRRRRRNCTCQN